MMRNHIDQNLRCGADRVPLLLRLIDQRLGFSIQASPLFDDRSCPVEKIDQRLGCRQGFLNLFNLCFAKTGNVTDELNEPVLQHCLTSVVRTLAGPNPLLDRRSKLSFGDELLARKRAGYALISSTLESSRVLCATAIKTTSPAVPTGFHRVGPTTCMTLRSQITNGGLSEMFRFPLIERTSTRAGWHKRRTLMTSAERWMECGNGGRECGPPSHTR